MRKIPYLLISILLFWGPEITGQSIANQRNDALQKGINLAGWLENTQVNPARFDKADFLDFVEAGFVTVRMPVRFAIYMDTLPPYRLDTNDMVFSIIDTIISWTEELGLNLIIDNHHGWEDLANTNYQSYIPRVGALWRQITKRYGHLDPEYNFLEIMNEPPLLLGGAPFSEFMQAMIDTIRLYSTEHTIIVSPPTGSSQFGFPNLVPFNDTNLIYTWHLYTPLDFTHQGASWTPIYYPIGTPFPNNTSESSVINGFNMVKTWSDQHNLPIFLGEFGVINFADSVSRCNWIQVVGEHIYLNGFSWAYWDWDNPGGGGFGIFEGNQALVEEIIPCFHHALRLYGYEPTGVPEIHNEENIIFYPNPSEGSITIRSDLPIVDGHFYLYDLTGREIEHQLLKDGQNNLSISGLNPGIYILKVHWGQYSKSQKLIIR